jgi:predicted HicB family RNase H-like nuclease
MGAKYTAAQKAATEKYQKTLSNISIRIKKEDYTIYKSAAAAAGQSLRDYVITALDEKIQRDSGGGSSL